MTKESSKEECRCLVCGRILKSPKSKALQMGPTCARKVIGFVKGEAGQVIVITRKRSSLYGESQRRLFTRGN